MEKRRFQINISCASCGNKLAKVFKNYPEIEYTLNILEKMIIVEADEEKYNDDFIIELVKKAGYIAEAI